MYMILCSDKVNYLRFILCCISILSCDAQTANVAWIDQYGHFVCLIDRWSIVRKWNREQKTMAEAVKIVDLDTASGRPSLNLSTVKRIINSRGTQDLPTIIVSIGGVARSGKSFLLNLMVNYLQYVEKVCVTWYIATNVNLLSYFLNVFKHLINCKFLALLTVKKQSTIKVNCLAYSSGQC